MGDNVIRNVYHLACRHYVNKDWTHPFDRSHPPKGSLAEYLDSLDWETIEIIHAVTYYGLDCFNAGKNPFPEENPDKCIENYIISFSNTADAMHLLESHKQAIEEKSNLHIYLDYAIRNLGI